MLAADRDDLRLQLGVNARAAVDLAAALVRRADEHRQPKIVLRPQRGRPLAPGVITCGRDLEGTAEDPDRVVRLLRVDEAEPKCWSFAKKAAAGSRISRSIGSSRFSLRSRASSSRSTVVSPVLPWVRSARARSTHVRSADSVRSRSRATCRMVLPSSSTSRTAPTLNSSVKLRRTRFGLFPSSMIDTVSASRLVSTKRGEAQSEGASRASR